MKKRTLLLAMISATIATLTPPAIAQERPEISKYVKAYSGTEGIKVWTLRIGPVDKNEALLQVGGVDHPWDMKIQKVKVEPSSRGFNYVATVDNKPYVVLVLQGSYGELYLPGSGDPRGRIGFDQSLSDQSNAEYFLTDYLAQSKKK